RFSLCYEYWRSVGPGGKWYVEDASSKFFYCVMVSFQESEVLRQKGIFRLFTKREHQRPEAIPVALLRVFWARSCFRCADGCKRRKSLAGCLLLLDGFDLPYRQFFGSFFEVCFRR